MSDFQKIEDEFYGSKYISKFHSSKYGNPNELWQNIKQNKDLLLWATELTKDKFGQRDLVNGLAISEAILIDYANVDKEVYDKLVKSIYNNKDIARIVLDGYSNVGFSFLLMSLWNQSLKLNEKQKEFAVSEAMNKNGTKNNPEKYLIGNTQVHGNGAFDIRYMILKNFNWTREEKQKLIMDFWINSNAYEDCLEKWELNLLDSIVLYTNNIYINSINEITYDYLVEYVDDKNIADSLWEETKFCKLMHELRPQQYELELKKEKQHQLSKTDRN